MPRGEPESRSAGGRTGAFGDDVFAIAVTLLVLDLHVPESFAPNAAAGFYLVIALVTVARARGDTPSPGVGAGHAV